GVSVPSSFIVPSGTDRCLLRDCLGELLLDGYACPASPGFRDMLSRALVIERCAHVTLRNCTLQGYEAMHAEDSHVGVENSTLTGMNAFFVPFLTVPAGTGAVLASGVTTFARCHVSGGNGLLADPSRLQTFTPPTPAISAHGSAMVRLCEDATASYVAG